MDESTLRAAYSERHDLLVRLACSLEQETSELLATTKHIDRVAFRAKGVTSFVEKALDPENKPPYTYPLEEIEDQVAGRVLVFFLSDIEPVRRTLEEYFNPVESNRRRPAKDEEFGYESHHIVFTIPPQAVPEGWHQLDEPPTTFELQLRTLFMHAYAEPQHDLGYKGSKELPPEVRRELAWVAASAWGADAALQRVLEQTETIAQETEQDP